jgi:uncharacterized membrane protein (Fun14 family)
MDPTVLKEACKISLAYTGAFTFQLLFQAKDKVSAITQHAQQKKLDSKLKFNRYENEQMLISDRIVGNFLEFGHIFLVLFWVNAVLNQSHVWVGWIWIASRYLYPFLANMGGITRAGAQPIIFIATFPMYGVLIFYAIKCYQALYY